MQIDKTTLSDISIFNEDEEQSIFNYINFTKTIGGKDWLKYFLTNPFNNVDEILKTQATIKEIIQIIPQWNNTKISNGTIMVLQKYFETSVAEIPKNTGTIGAATYTIFNNEDFTFIKYSVKHFVDFFNGLDNLSKLISANSNVEMLQNFARQIADTLNKAEIQKFLYKEKNEHLSKPQLLTLGYFLKRKFKQETIALITIYSKLDAYFSMAIACVHYNFCFPKFVNTNEPLIIADNLFHPLLSTPVTYNINLNQNQNFLFLTGANMGGKSTFIKAVGVSVFLAHVGMGVPAKQMQLSLFNGLLSNINVVDNLIQGESYFYNEVQRIKKTIEKITDGKKWLILIDELFKGTNVLDAMKCSSSVIEGLLKIKKSSFILSTHLYEIGENLKKYTNIQFKYFETSVINDQLNFSYLLKDGISNDRLGYLILKREGVIDLLTKLK